MTKNRRLILPAVLAGIALLVVAALYLAEAAGDLPSFFPGHEAGSGRHHVKHGIAAAAVAAACFVVAWFQTEPKSRRGAAAA